MKKFGKRLMSILLTAALTVGGVAVTGITANAATDAPTYSGKECQGGSPDIESLYGKTGQGGENFELICDGNTRTKYCVRFNTTDKPFFIFAPAKDDQGNRSSCVCTGYTLTTANDTSVYKGRNPKSWTIYGSNDFVEPTGFQGAAPTATDWQNANSNATWTIVKEVKDDSTLQPVDYTPYNFTIDTNDSTPSYKFFRFVVDANGGDNYFQLSELKIYIKKTDNNSEHVVGQDAKWVWTKNDQSSVKLDAGLEFTCTQCGNKVCVKADSVNVEENAENHLKAKVTINNTEYSNVKYYPCIEDPQAKKLSFNGSEQDLLTEGQLYSNKCHFEYVVSDSEASHGNTWKTEMPKEKNAGTYYVFYRVAGETNNPNPDEYMVKVVMDPKKVDSAEIVLPEEKITYDGNEKTPAVKVMDGETEIETDQYNVSYSDNIEIGTATVTVKNIENGNYIFEASETFEIEEEEKQIEESTEQTTEQTTEQITEKTTEEKKDDKKEDKKEEMKTPKYSNEWVDGKWYDAEGNQTYAGTLSWKSDSTGWWVEDSEGWYPTSQWQKIDGIWYYFNASGYMASGEYYDGCWFNTDGSWDEQYYLTWKSDSTGWWVEDKSGWWPSSQWLKIDGSWYYFDGSGYMVTSQYVDGYWIGSDGVCN